MLARPDVYWRPDKAPSQLSCLCKMQREGNYMQRKIRGDKLTGYFWHKWMSFLEQRLFNVSTASRDSNVVWMQDANFAVGRAAIRRNGRWLYEVMHRLTTVEDICMNSGSMMWAHSFERLWYYVFHPSVPKRLKAGDEGGSCLVRHHV